MNSLRGICQNYQGIYQDMPGLSASELGSLLTCGRALNRENGSCFKCGKLGHLQEDRT